MVAEPVWYRSFYWRIALGFIACVAGLLIAQAAFFVWLADRAGMPLLARNPEHLATVVASDLSAALESDPKLDLQQYLQNRFGTRTPQVVVVMKDGRVFHSGTTEPNEFTVRSARFRLLRGWTMERPEDGGPFRPRFERDRELDRERGTRPDGTPAGPRRYRPFGQNESSAPAASPSSPASPRADAHTPGTTAAEPAQTAEPREAAPPPPPETSHGEAAARAGAEGGEPGLPFGPGPGPGLGGEGADGRQGGMPGGGPGVPGGPGNRPRPELFPQRRSLSGPIVINGATVGLVVIVPTGVPPFVTLREFGPTLAAAGGLLLLIGTATMAFLVFRPARRRLRTLEEAAEQIGAGDTSVRAPVQGGDEVAALANAFNRMAADLDARVRELQEADRMRRQLLADVSHELMTPLTAIRGYLETLAFPAAVKDEETRERYLQIVTDETLRLEAIIGDLLDLARLEGGGATLQHEVVPVDALFARAAERHGPVLHDRAVTLETHVDPSATQVEGDGRRLEQAIQNLVANAVRHTPRGGRIELSSAQVNGHVRLRVQDNGPGIPPEHLPRVFDRFYRVDAARDQASGGSGLGLSIVRAIVEAHGGSVTAAPAEGGGAVFDILLDRPPSQTPSASPSAAASFSPSSSASPSSLSSSSSSSSPPPS